MYGVCRTVLKNRCKQALNNHHKRDSNSDIYILAIIHPFLIKTRHPGHPRAPDKSIA